MNDENFNMIDPVNRKTANEVHDVWQTIDNLKGDVGQLKTDMSAIGVKIDNLAQVLTTVMTQTTEATKTPWNLILGLLAIVISIITAGAGAVLAPLYLSDSYYNDMTHKHIESDGHPETVKILSGIEKDINRLDAEISSLKIAITENNNSIKDQNNLTTDKIESLHIALQREMRDLDATQLARIDGLDTTLQREMRMADALTEARVEAATSNISSLQEEISNLENRVLITESDRYTGSRAHNDHILHNDQFRRQSERIAALEAELGKFKADTQSMRPDVQPR